MPKTRKDIEGEDPWKDAQKKHGISADLLAKKLKQELYARETKFFQHEGKVEEIRNVVAWGIRQKARQDAHRLRGDYPVEKLEHSGEIIFKSNVPEPDPLPEEDND